MERKTKELVEEILYKIGLNKNEVTIYLDLIQYNLSSAVDISKRTSLHRTNIYDSLRQLVTMGFVYENINNNLKLYYAVEPTKIKTYIDEQSKQFMKLLPELTNINQKQSNENIFLCSTGNFSAKQEIIQLIQQENEVMIFGLSFHLFEKIGIGFTSKFINTIKKNENKVKIIFNNNQDKTKIRGKYIETKVYDDKNLKSVFFISKNLIIIIVNDTPVKVLKIKDSDVGYSYKKFFEIMWENVK
ncbi:MAG: TrmB family transcriptional regulator [Nanoarchaeota archaeon]